MYKAIIIPAVALTMITAVSATVTSATAIDPVGGDQSSSNRSAPTVSRTGSSGVKGDSVQDMLQTADQLQAQDCDQTQSCDPILDNASEPDQDRDRDRDRVVDPDAEQDRDRDQDRIIDPSQDADQDCDRDQTKLNEPGSL